ncbi:MAG TPA: aldehyde dehydrogenase family protein, partial [Sphingomicrobium sp.]|nr:aldehyde dehydrogenase family protein [Sphingomicrobium sp.]
MMLDLAGDRVASDLHSVDTDHRQAAFLRRVGATGSGRNCGRATKGGRSSSPPAATARAADIIDWYAEEGRRAYGRIVPGRQKGVRQIVLQEPVGVVAAFTPWNFPTLTPVRKIAGALAAGCSLIIKASEETPGGCVELVKCFVDAGVPAGVLNLVFGV